MPPLTADRTPDVRLPAVMVLLCASWGVQQVVIKAALPDVPPFTQCAVRSAVAAVAIVAWSLASGHRLRFPRQTWFWGVVAGLVFGIEYTLVYLGISMTEATRASLFFYTAPFFVVLMGWFLLPSERLGMLQMSGLVLAFVGVAVALSEHSTQAMPLAWVGDLLVLLGAALWALTTVIIKATALREASVEEIVMYQLVFGAVVGTGMAFAVGEHSSWPSTTTILSLAYQSIWVGTATFLIWFGLIARYSANLLSAYTFLTPLFGIAAGYFLLGEPISVRFAVACVLTLAGLVIVNRPSATQRERARELTENSPSGRA